MLVDKIKNRETNILLYGITPPKKGTEPDKVKEIAGRQMARLQPHAIDGLILYDIQDEASRTDEERPFPYIETLDPYDYSQRELTALKVPKVIYRAVGKYAPDELAGFLNQASASETLTVFVGASSQIQKVSLTLPKAYRLKADTRSELVLGGVTIPERHTSKGDEHLRVFEKIAQGCRFFVSQGVYDINAAKNLLSEYYYYGREHGIPLAPIIFTLTPCGSRKTLEFMKWLGISIPKWLENELIHSPDTIDRSLEFCEQNWLELKRFADEKGIPIGCNVESVAIRKVEVDASIELLERVARSMGR